MTINTIDTVAGIRVPDTPLVREVTEFIRDAEDDCCSTTPAGCSSSARCRAAPRAPTRPRAALRRGDVP